MNETYKNQFETIESWKAYLSRATNENDLNGAVRLLRAGERTTAGIHNFHLTNKMGLAYWCINKRAEQIGYYKLGSGFYRKTNPQ